MKYASAHQLTVDSMNDIPKPTVTIKKYANRRLYNTATSTYVTLETLSGMVKDGIDFAVYDAKTSEDITRSVLTQIIVEEEGKSGQQNLLPISFLRQLIGFYGDNMQWLVPKYLEHSMNMLANNQEQITSYFQTTFGNIFPFGTTFEEMGKKNLEMFERTLRMFSPFAATTTDTKTTDGKETPAAAAPMPPATPKPSAEKPKEARSIRIDTPATKPEALATVTNIRRPEPTPIAVEAEPVIAKATPAPDPVTVTKPEPKPEPAPVITPPKAADTVIPPSSALTTPEPVAIVPVEPIVAKAPEPVIAAAPAVAPTPAPEPKPAPTPVAVATTPEPAPATKPAVKACSIDTASAPTSVMPTTPMPNVQQTVMASPAPTAEDMQQKIANLQRQLAELAKNRA